MGKGTVKSLGELVLAMKEMGQAAGHSRSAFEAMHHRWGMAIGTVDDSNEEPEETKAATEDARAIVFSMSELKKRA